MSSSSRRRTPAKATAKAPELAVVEDAPVERKRLRLVGVTVVPVVMVDDGTNLTPLEVQPVSITAERLDELAGTLRDGLVALEEQLNAPAPEQGDAPSPTD